MAELVGAVLLDTRSIQKYVFYSNKLKTNIGASYLVERIFYDAAKLAIGECGFENAVTDWDSNTDLCKKNENVDCEIANIGGGNMLILVRDGKDALAKCRELVSRWSEKVLLMAPGLKVGAAIGMLDLSETGFENSLKELYKQLKENQNNIMPETDLPYTGLTLECDYSGKTANTLNTTDHRLIAAEVKAKMEAYNYAARNLREEYADILGSKYDFCSEFKKLGYKDGESYISVIHIDGNNMGVKFNTCEGLQERKELSLKIAKAVKNAFRKLLNDIVKQYEAGKYDDYLEMKNLTDKNTGQKYLPLRPIIIGGDDITFVCPARLGLEYARRFIKYANEEVLFENGIDENRAHGTVMKTTLSTCGGVAIVPDKYPFFRAYDLAEQLCSAAKKKSRANDDCLIDYAILHGEMSSSLDWLREKQYKAVCGGLYYGPYDVVNSGSDKYIGKLYSLQQTMQNMLPENKRKELRSVLHQNKHEQVIYLENCKEMREILKQQGKDAAGADDLWIKNKSEKTTATPYMDAIEIADFVIPGLDTEA